MIRIKCFTFNYFSENTYLLYDESKECVIIDPGCLQPAEEEQLSKFMESEGLKPVLLLNTHCHIDHIFGNRYVAEKYKLAVWANALELANIRSADIYSSHFGVPAPNSPEPGHELNEGDTIRFGNSELEVLFTPGHSAGHVVFYCRPQNFVIGGDVLFRQSIGRTDLPGGDLPTLLNSIKDKLFPLGDAVTVYPGHGPATTIGYEKQNNYYLQELQGV